MNKSYSVVYTLKFKNADLVIKQYVHLNLKMIHLVHMMEIWKKVSDFLY